jgi:hypothetical protein
VGGIVIALTCPPDICLKRIDSSNPKNPKTLEEYAAHQVIENSPDENGYGSHTVWCIENANVAFNTSKPLSITLSEVNELLASNGVK